MSIFRGKLRPCFLYFYFRSMIFILRFLRRDEARKKE